MKDTRTLIKLVTLSLLILIGKLAFGAPTELRVNGESSANGIYDPSVAATSDNASVVVMAYSSISNDRFNIDTSIAVSVDGGQSWHKVNTVFKSQPMQFILNGQFTVGTLIYEVPTLVYDKSNRIWHLMAHSYVVDPNHIRVEGTHRMVYARSQNPASGQWTQKEILFGSSLASYREDIFGKPKYYLNLMHNNLSDMSIMTEPGLFYKNNTLYLAFSSYTGGDNESMQLIKSSNGGGSWEYVGILIDRSTAELHGFDSMGGANLVKENGQIFLLATPNDFSSTAKYFHNGTMIIPVQDIATAKLFKQNGFLKVCRHIQPIPYLNSSPHGSGQATFWPSLYNSGMLSPQLDLDEEVRYTKIYKTGITSLIQICQ